MASKSINLGMIITGDHNLPSGEVS